MYRLLRLRPGVALLFAVVLFVSAPTRSGTLTPDPLLGSIESVRLIISLALAYEPIRALDRNALEDAIRERVSLHLQHEGIRSEDSSRTFLLVSVRHAWDGEARDHVALMTSFTLYVPGQPIEVADSRALARERSLSIWQQHHLELAPTPTARAVILGSVDLALEDLSSALRKVKRDTEGHIPRGGSVLAAINSALLELEEELKRTPALAVRGTEDQAGRDDILEVVEQQSPQGQFELKLRADWRLLGRGEVLAVEYHLFNGGDTPVCIGEGEDIFRNERKMAAAPTPSEPRCGLAGMMVRVGETGVWSSTWPGIPCLSAAQVPVGFAESFPELMCGSTISIRAQIRAFQSEEGRTYGPGFLIMSEPVLVPLEAKDDDD